MGTLWLMPFLDVSISLISLFAFILVLGIVVDDAIIVGENIYTQQHRQRTRDEGFDRRHERGLHAGDLRRADHRRRLRADAQRGRGDGQDHAGHPADRDPLPALVAGRVALDPPGAPVALQAGSPRPLAKGVRRIQGTVSDGLHWFVDNAYAPFLAFALRWRYVTLAVALSPRCCSRSGLVVGGGFVKLRLLPRRRVRLHLRRGDDAAGHRRSSRPSAPSTSSSKPPRSCAPRSCEETGEEMFRYMIAAIGEQPFRRQQAERRRSAAGRPILAQLGELTIELLPGEERTVGSPRARRALARADRHDPRRRSSSPSRRRCSRPATTSTSSSPAEDLDELRRAADRLKAKPGRVRRRVTTSPIRSAKARRS